jgi:hypothetical protein
MKQSFIVRSALLLAAVGLMTMPLHADIVTLKNGDKVEGKILEETADSIRIEYHLTPKIKDTKTIPKATIQGIKKQTASEVEIEERGFRKILPTPDLLSAGDYEAIIQDKLRVFTAKYPGSPEAAEVEKIIEDLTAEKARVSAGELKVEGKWLDAATVKRDTYNIEAYRLRLEMKQKAAELKDDRYLNALRSFEKLRTQYPASLQYVQAIPEAIQIMNSFEKQLGVMLTEQPVLAEKRAAGLRALQGTELELTKSSVQKEEQAFKLQYAEQLKNRVKWKDVYKYDKPSLMEAQKTLLSSRTELQGLDLDSVQKENEAYLAVIRYMAEGKVAEAESSLERLGAVAQSSVSKASSTIVSDLKKQFAVIKKQDIEKRKADAKNAQMQPPPAATTPGDAEGTSAVEEALRKAEEKRKNKNAQPKGDDKPKADKTDAKSGEKKEGDAEKPKTAAAAPEEEETMMDKIVANAPYIGGGIVVILLFAVLKGRKKQEE